MECNNPVSIEDLIATQYEQRYFDECKFIWQNYVPKKGKAHNLQGELLREIERIRCEAQDNGNINWDEEFNDFCKFITDSLLSQSVFTDGEKQKIRTIMEYIGNCGAYASRYNDGKVADKDVNPAKSAYVNDNLYDMICDYIGKLQRNHPNPIAI